ncbi:hypothetical protein BDN71DRAFT_1431658 [Pleurotus eryngii]|uniref:Uncharacterized protein n=1 Tax=Pleurotus eryngii TaxID=5323 RepID=A0A9P5ZYE0_PLEER|nr:hypothetical protein BDN71DRAFT_1431658 [Pleurotus eryngii]
MAKITFNLPSTFRTPSLPYNGAGKCTYENIVKPYLQELGPSLFTTLQSIIHLTASLAHNTFTLPQFTMAMMRDRFSIDGHPITFKSFCELRDVGAGYSFMSDPNNPLASGKSLLIQHFLRAGCHDFLIHMPSGAHPEVFRPFECAIWLSDVDRLVEALYAATVATWPGAGHGTELDHLTYNNQRGQRHLFLINNILTFITLYSKTQKMTGKAWLIPCGVDPRLARVFIIVYYAAQVIMHQIGDDSSSSAYSKYIFVRHGTLLNTDAMMHILRSFTNNHFHYQDEDEEQDTDWAPINSLFSHGQCIADTVYGIEADSLMDLTQPDVARAH